MEELISSLSRLCPGGVHRNVSLAQFSRWKIGGIADLVVEPGSLEELSALRAFISREGLANVVIGETSNLLFADEGLRAICIRIGSRLANVQVDGDELVADAGIWVPCFARRVMQAGLTGAEHICGIPGTLGGLICMNGGSQGNNIGTAVLAVTAVNKDGVALTLSQKECGFAYRRSVFQEQDLVISKARLRFLQIEEKRVVRRQMSALLHDRNCKFPRKKPNCGSVFKSNPAMYAEFGPPGAVIERMGFKGYRIGDAVVSTQHANFFVNEGSARAADMLRLIREVREAVYAESGHQMEAEVRFVTQEGSIVSA
ncbi:UDP-N-acetylmuramate dehydrogenase [Halorhodospira halophila]|uniref:UDP-N-acetylenolpyruvoylglucosamine reductase n=1 Tax=Halorhodospira halophila (strain DSM 244 / SL1) TaxID=349124 RepID=A1WV27_HALHL|nr:UDP-N-acetylmuramate dehydrogenase [Halorhodospira halophila]ABM61539.1 UDP-N-acetylmuramate dehydrogenase [Halorhodospira halophila SL1]MBK1728786.1 UDP-N-acetylenolpyruvoylglucosamine reductase [Halorhodospira halophila]